jgi:acyl-coenzyme A thioesterase PaaI-like protein
MTDLPLGADNVPGRMGATARIVGDELVVELATRPAVLRHGVVRASVLSYLVDCVAGIPLQAPDAWTLTTDMTVRALPVPAPPLVVARFRPLRRGRRTATGRVVLEDQDGAVVGDGAIGFASVRHREGDPPLPRVTLEQVVAHFGSLPPVEEPLREAAGIAVVDAAAGVVEVEVTNALRNPAGTLQGAMTALVAEAAAEEALSVAAGDEVVVTDLDLRYLSRTGTGPVRSRTTLLGAGASSAAVVELVDLSTDEVVALVHARGAVR